MMYVAKYFKVYEYCFLFEGVVTQMHFCYGGKHISVKCYNLSPKGLNRDLLLSRFFYLLVFHIFTVQMHISVPLIFDFDCKML